MFKLRIDKKNKIAIGIVIGLIFCIILGATFNIYRNIKDMFGSSNPRNDTVNPNDNDVRNEIGTYILHSNPTQLQQEVYDELIKKMNEYAEGWTEELTYEISELVVKSFISDFYTWTNKVGNYDVGGMDYVYGSSHLNISLQARDTFYNDLDLYLKDYGSSDLLEVESITAKASYIDPFEYDGQVFNASFYVWASWTYKDSKVLDTTDFQNQGSFIVVYNEKHMRFEIVCLSEDE